MADPAKTVDQNLLPVQAYFNLDGSFNTFIGQGQPFYATANPLQSGLTITNSTLDSSPIGSTSPSTGVFTNISTTTGTISTTPSSATDIANKFYVDTVAQGLGPKAACAVGTTVNITLSGLQTIDGYTTLSGDRVLVKNQSSSQFNGIYIASASAWTRSTDMDVWSEVPGAYTVVLNGGQADTGWVCTATQSGTINVTAMPWVQFSGSATYYAGTGLTLASNTFSITNTGVSASTYGSASIVPVLAVNAQGQITSASNSTISIAPSQINATIPNSGLTNSSITVNGSTIALGGSATITANTTNALTIGTGLSGTSFNGSSAVTIANTGVLSVTGTSPVNASTVSGATTVSLASGYGDTQNPYASKSAAYFLASPTGSSGVPTFRAIATTDIPTLNQNTTGTASNVTGVVAVANGGTGVSSSSGANSVVLRDSNGNITTNCLFEGYVTQAASGTTIVLTASSAQNYQITGSGGQIIRLPDATTLPNGATFTFNNNQSSGAITVQNNSSTTVATINSGGYVTVVLLNNSTAAGSWDRHDSTPSNVSWSTNTLDYPGSITSATWNGSVIALNRGGTNANLTANAGAVSYSTSTALALTAVGTSGQVLTSNGTSAPTWQTVSGSGATITDDTTTNATEYPLFSTTTSGSLSTVYTSSTKYKYNPSTGTLTATVFSGNLAASNLTGTTLPSSIVTSSLTSVGTIGTGVWNGTTIGILYGGTGQTTANAAFNALAPSQTSNSGKYLTTDGTNTSWASLGNTYTRTSFTATASQTTFTVSYTVGLVQVYVNGVLLNGSDYTASNGTSVVLATGCNSGDIVETIAYSSFSVASTVSSFSGGTTGLTPSSPATGNVTLGGVLNATNGGFLAWQSVQTANFTAVNGQAYPVNTTSGAVTVTLPASPSAGNFVTIVDYAGTAATNNIIINPNGSKIQSSSSNGLINVNRQSYNFVYIDSTQGWLSYSQQYQGSVSTVYAASYLIAAGGGAGGGAQNNDANGGGGAGGLVTGTTNFTAGTVYTVVVGAGGSGSSGATGGSGSNSSITGLTTAVGGGGGAYRTGAAGSGGSGGGMGNTGGSVGSGTSGQGNNGGTSAFNGTSGGAGAGGGSGAVGGNGSTTGGVGGVGTSSSITGTAVFYAGGGGGASSVTGGAGGNGGGGAGGGGGATSTGTAGTVNTGGGGGGGWAAAGQSTAGAAGGSGIVIISVLSSQYSGITTGSPTITTSGTNTIMKFTASGSYTA